MLRTSAEQLHSSFTLLYKIDNAIQPENGLMAFVFDCLFKEHDANNQQIPAIFTDKNYQEIKSCSVLESGNGHIFETIVVGDILTDIL